MKEFEQLLRQISTREQLLLLLRMLEHRPAPEFFELGEDLRWHRVE